MNLVVNVYMVDTTGDIIHTNPDLFHSRTDVEAARGARHHFFPRGRFPQISGKCFQIKVAQLHIEIIIWKIRDLSVAESDHNVWATPFGLAQFVYRADLILNIFWFVDPDDLSRESLQMLVELTAYNLQLPLFCSPTFGQREHHRSYLQYIAITTDSNFSLDDKGGVVPSGVYILRLRHYHPSKRVVRDTMPDVGSMGFEITDQREASLANKL
jgi:hypothetical protein